MRSQHARRRRRGPAARTRAGRRSPIFESAVSVAGQSIVPANGHEVIVRRAAVVVDVRRDDVARRAPRPPPARRPRGARGRRRGRRRRRRVRGRRRASRRSASGVARSLGITSSARRTPALVQRARRSARGCGAARRGRCRRRESAGRAACRGAARPSTQPRPRAALDGASRLVDRLVPRGRVGRRVRVRAAPDAVREAVADRRVHAATPSRPSASSQRRPPATRRAIVVVEVRPRREDFDEVEAVRGDRSRCARGRAARRGTDASRGRSACSGPLIRVGARDVSASSSRRRANRVVLVQVLARVPQRARDVLDVDGIAAAPSSDSRTCRAP